MSTIITGSWAYTGLYETCRAGQELPHNFDLIPLNQAMKNRLREMGIPYRDPNEVMDVDEE